MGDLAIRVEGLSKRYRIGQREPYKALRDVLAGAATAPFRRRRGESRPAPETIWALKDVSFEVKRGEVLGIIGRNGAGKSTLLKILSRITAPTEGGVDLYGRVGSLLEVGTGFHPELTGRENIYLNGAILGMKRAEIARRFDEIVAFAEIEQFLDTPVKRYSSGMFVRLAFAVAAHLETEILLVDEVLAVGDAQFQKKCLGKMGEVAGEGRTVLFVSHNMQAVQHMCQRTVLLKWGSVTYLGHTREAVLGYYGMHAGRASMLHVSDTPCLHADRGAILRSVGFFDDAGRPCTSYLRTDRARIRVVFSAGQLLSSFNVAMAFVHADGVPVFSGALSDQANAVSLAPGDYAIEFSVDMAYFKIEPYFLTIYLLNEGSPLDHLDGLPVPAIIDPSADSFFEAHRWGLVRLPVAWSEIRYIESWREYG